MALKALVEAGVVMPVIDRTFTLRETPQAIAHAAGGRARGTVVLSIASESQSGPISTLASAG